MKNKKNLILNILLITLITISTISAFGVSSPYWGDNPLIISKGETKIVNLNLQNIVGEEDIEIKAELIEGSDITSLKEETFIIKAGTSDTIVPLKIRIPKETSLGETKPVKIDFKTIPDKTSGISMGTGMTVYFDVIVTSEKNEKNNVGIALIGIISVLSVLWLILRKKKKK